MNCLDAETLAAWFDGGLSGAALDDVRSHVAGCARCQALVGAMGRTRSAAPAVPQPQRRPRWWLAWAVPAAAAATAVVIWVAVPHQTNVAVNPVPVPSLQKLDAPEQNTPPPAARSEAAAPPATPATSARQARAKEAEAAPPAAPPPAANEAVPQAPGSLNEAVSVRSAASARAAPELRDQAEQRAAFATSLCGPAWPSPPSDVAGQITVGSSPSAAVCWIVGRAGAVLRSTDQRTWQRLSFPVTVDLTSVNATDAQSATVVTADGRTFSTVDGGVTWMQP